MCCQNTNHGHKNHGCCCTPKFHRHFYSEEERKQQLKEYKKELEKEIEAIEKTLQQ